MAMAKKIFVDILIFSNKILPARFASLCAILAILVQFER